MLKLAHICRLKRRIINAFTDVGIEVAIGAFAFAERVVDVDGEWLHGVKL